MDYSSAPARAGASNPGFGRSSEDSLERGRTKQARRSQVIYFWHEVRATCYMLFLYRKNEQGDLTARQTRALAQLVRKEFR